MAKTLAEIVQQLHGAAKKVQLIYAFNGTGKTRLSRAFKERVIGEREADGLRRRILYYNAFTEDLFYWDNGLAGDQGPTLKIQPNAFTDWILRDQGLDRRIVDVFQALTGSKTEPVFDVARGSIRFENPEAFPQSFPVDFGGDHNGIKISKGEESSFIWSVFYALLEQVIAELNIAEAANRSTEVFNSLAYVFIDDPVSSLDDNHLIELAVNLAGLIKSSRSDLKFIITTHSPLFYNVLFNELGNGKACFLLERFEDGTFALAAKDGHSNTSFSYHLHLKQTLERAIADDTVERYHFTLLRNLYEKTASFLGYPRWAELLPDEKELYYSRVINFTSHSTLSGEAVAEPSPAEKAMVKRLLDHLTTHYGFWAEEKQNG